MKSTLFTTLLILLWVSTVYLPLSDAQDATTSELPDEPKLRLHGGRVVTSVAFSPDGKTLASVSRNDQTIRLWDVATGEQKHTLPGNAFVAFSPDGQTLATGGDDGTLRLWDVNSGEHRQTRTGHVGWVYSAAFSPDGNTIASVSSNGREPVHVHVWDVNSGERLRTLTGHTNRVYSVAFSPDGNTIASGDLGGTLRLYDANSGEPLQTLTGQGIVLSVAFSPDGNTIASGGVRLPIHLWDANTGRPLPLRPLTGHTNKVNSIAFSPDGNTIVSGGDDGTIHLWDWDANSGEPLQTLTGHTNQVYSVAFSPDGNTIASGSWDGTVLLWEITPTSSNRPVIEQNATIWGLPDGAKARIGKGTILDMRYTPDGQYLKVASSIGSWLYDAETHQELGIRLISKPILGVIPGAVYASGAISPDGTTWARGGYGKDVLLSDIETDTIQHTLAHPTSGGSALLFSPNGKMLLTTDTRSSVYLWDVETGKRLHTFMESYTHSAFVRAYCFSPDSATLALGHYNNVRLWDVETGKLLHTLDNKAMPSCIGFSPDGKTIASGRLEQSRNDHIRLWDVKTGTYLRSLTAPSTKISINLGRDAGGFTSIAFSQDNKMLASGSIDGQTRLWAVETGRFIDTMRPDTVYTDAALLTDTVWSVAFSPDGDTLAISYLGGTLRLWDVATRRNFRTIGYTSSIYSIAFSPDGKTLATGSGSYNVGACSLWNVETGTLRHAFTADRTSVYSVAFSPDGNTLATGGLDNTLRLWDVETGDLVRAIPGGDPYRDPDSIYGLSFSPDSKRLAIAREKTVDVLEVETGTYSHKVGSYRSADSIAFSPDSKTLATFNASNPGSSDQIRLWDVETRTHQCSLFLSEFVFGRVFSLTFTPDSKTLAVGYSHGTHLWDVETCEKHRRIYDSGAILSPDGKIMATMLGNFDGRVIDVPLLDVNTQALVNTIEDVPVQPIRKGALAIQPLLSSLLFSPDSKTLASLTGDGTVLLWEITPTSPQGGENAADVNGDGVVDIEDLDAVNSALLTEASGNNADVNQDGIINIADLVLVAAAIATSEATVAAAPAALRQQASAHLTTVDVQHWLTQARELNLTDATSQRGILFLQYLLAALTPQETILLANYPNPFNPETWIPYQLAKPADVTLTIYDIQGRVVRDLDLGHQRAGMYKSRARAAYWDGRNAVGEPVASGLYFYTLTAGDFNATRKMLIRK